MDGINKTGLYDAKDNGTAPAVAPVNSQPAIREIPIGRIQANDLWVRSDWQEGLDSLAESIDADGILQFPGVRDNGDGTYTIIFGHRRYSACKQSGHRTIPCRILDVTEEEAALLLLVENLHRKQLHPVDEARTIRGIADKFHLKDVELARRMNWKKNVLNERLAVLRLPEEMQQKIGDDARSCFKFTHAVALSRLWDNDRSDRQQQARKLFDKTIRYRLSTTELKDLVALFQKGDFDRLPDRLRVALLSDKWMTAAMAQLFLNPHEAVVGKDRRAKALRATAKKLDRGELEELIAAAVRSELPYEKACQKLLKRLQKQLDAAAPNDSDHQSGVDRLLSCISTLDRQLATSRDEIEALTRANPKALGAIWFAIVQLQKKLCPMETLLREAVNDAHFKQSPLDEEPAHVEAG